MSRTPAHKPGQHPDAITSVQVNTVKTPLAPVGLKGIQNQITTDDALARLEEKRNQKFPARAFAPMEAGSMRGVVIMWVRLCYGVGLLTLPKYVKDYGLIPGVCAITLAAYLNYAVATYLFNAAHYAGKTDYSEVIKCFFGTRVQKFFDVLITIDLFSTVMMLIISSWKIFGFFIDAFGFTATRPHWLRDPNVLAYNEYHPAIFVIRAIYVAAVFFILLPFFMAEKLRSLQFLAYIYLGLLFTIVFFLLIETPFFIKGYSFAESPRLLFKELGWGAIENFGGLMFSFYVQVFLYSLIDILVDPSVRRLKKTARLSVFVEYIGLVLIGVCGYLSFGEKYTPNLFFLRKPYPGFPTWPEILLKIVLGCFLIVLIVGIGMFSAALKKQVYFLFNLKPENASRTQKLLISVVPLVLACLIALAYPFITDVFNILSISVCFLNGYMLPTILEIVWRKKTGHDRYVPFFVFTFLIFWEVFGVIAVIRSYIHK